MPSHSMHTERHNLSVPVSRTLETIQHSTFILPADCSHAVPVGLCAYKRSSPTSHGLQYVFVTFYGICKGKYREIFTCYKLRQLSSGLLALQKNPLGNIDQKWFSHSRGSIPSDDFSSALYYRRVHSIIYRPTQIIFASICTNRAHILLN